jgi:hypothetical protein
MVKKSLKNLPIPNIEKKHLTRSRKSQDKADKKVRHLDEMLDKSFLKDYFEQKKIHIV